MFVSLLFLNVDHVRPSHYQFHSDLYRRHIKYRPNNFETHSAFQMQWPSFEAILHSTQSIKYLSY